MQSFQSQGAVGDLVGSKNRAKKGPQEEALGHLNSYVLSLEEEENKGDQE